MGSRGGVHVHRELQHVEAALIQSFSRRISHELAEPTFVHVQGVLSKGVQLVHVSLLSSRSHDATHHDYSCLGTRELSYHCIGQPGFLHDSELSERMRELAQVAKHMIHILVQQCLGYSISAIRMVPQQSQSQTYEETRSLGAHVHNLVEC